MSGSAAIKTENGTGDSWCTPFDLWAEIQTKYLMRIEAFDPCPNLDRILPGTFPTYNPQPGSLFMDGLKMSWDPFTFVNPPFSDIAPWVSHASKQRGSVVMLLPVRSDQPWWHEYAPKALIVFIRGRVNYIDPARDKTTGASFPSCLWVFGMEPGVEFWWPECHKNRRAKA